MSGHEIGQIEDATNVTIVKTQNYNYEYSD